MSNNSKMQTLQRWLGIGTFIFVFIYLGAIVFTITSETQIEDQPASIESTRAREAERHLAIPELLLPMGILFTLAASFLIVRRRNARDYDRLDDDIDESDIELKPEAPARRP
jgi:hypothetical protein